MAIRTFGPNTSTGKSASTWTGSARERLARLQATLEAVVARGPALLRLRRLRYATATHIGTWAIDKLILFALIPPRGRPDRLGLRFGGAAPPAVQPLARHHAPRPRRRRPASRAPLTAPDPACRPCAGPRAGNQSPPGRHPSWSSCTTRGSWNTAQDSTGPLTLSGRNAMPLVPHCQGTVYRFPRICRNILKDRRQILGVGQVGAAKWSDQIGWLRVPAVCSRLTIRTRNQ